MREKIIVLGATGSIGRQCLDILKYSFDYELVGVSFNSQIDLIEPYLFYFDSLKYIAITDVKKAKIFQERHPSYVVLSGVDASVKLVKKCQATVFNSLMGNVGLEPTLTAIQSDLDVLLSNKESLVIGSSLIKSALKNSKSHLYPVDSEHVALAKLLKTLQEQGVNTEDILSLYVTASGGSLRDRQYSDLFKVSPQEVLHHPTWQMGNKITVDSATLVNKGFEVIEASVLFDFPLDKIKACICKESLVHALIEYKDKDEIKYIYEYSPCDMKVSIAYALSKGKMKTHKLSEEDEIAVKKLHFEEIDKAFYPAFELTIKMFKKYSNIGMIYYNAVDTAAIEAFLKNKIGYLDIYKSLKYTYDHLQISTEVSIESLSSLIKTAEAYADDVVKQIGEK